MDYLQKQKELLCKMGRLAYDKGMVVGSGGNISFRWEDGMFITPHGCTLDEIKPEDLIFMSFEKTYEGEVQPSVEAKLHTACYLKRNDVQAIIHLHSYHSIIVGIMAEIGKETMPAYTGSYAYKVGRTGIVPLYKSGNDELCSKVAQELENTSVVLMKNHGVVACGRDIRAAFSLCEDVEMNARLHVLLKGEGALTEEQVASIM